MSTPDIQPDASPETIDKTRAEDYLSKICRNCIYVSEGQVGPLKDDEGAVCKRHPPTLMALPDGGGGLYAATRWPAVDREFDRCGEFRLDRKLVAMMLDLEI